MPKERKGTVNEDSLLDVPTDEVATDAKKSPTEPLPDDFFGDLMTTENPLDALSSENTVIDDPAKPEPEPEETPEPAEVEDEEVEDEEEEVEASEGTADPKRRGKPRNVRYREKLQRQDEAIATLTKELESLRVNKPIVDMVLEEARLRGQEPGKPALKAPERPTRPVRPANFSRERASEDPESADAKFLDAREEYQDSMEDYQLDKEAFDHKVTETNAIEAEEKQVVAAQEKWWSDFNDGLASEARKDPSIKDDQVTAEVQKVIEFLAKPEAYDPRLMWRFGRAVLNAPKGAKPAKTPVKSPRPAPITNIPPVPSVATGNASVADMPKGWIQGADAEEVAEQFQKDMASL